MGVPVLCCHQILFAYPRGLEACIHYYCFDFGVLFCHTVVKSVKCHAVMHIARIYRNIYHISMFITGCLSCICKTFFMFSLVENSTVWVGRRFIYNFLFGRLRSVKGLLSVLLSVLVYLFQKLFFIDFCSFGYFSFYNLFDICVCFDMCSVNKYRFG